MIDLDKMERGYVRLAAVNTLIAAMPISALIAELRNARVIVEAARGLLEDVDYPGADGLGASESDWRPRLHSALAVYDKKENA